jgi:hypothetical protein
MIKKAFCATIAFILCVSVVSFAFTVDWSSVDEFAKWATFYYVKPEPDKVPIAMIYASESSLYASGSHVSLMAFFAALFRKDQALMNTTYTYIEKEGGANARVSMMEALRLTFTPEGQALLAKAKASWLSEKTRGNMEGLLSDFPTEYLSVRTNNSKFGTQDEDILWLTFFATGDKEPVQKMISLMHLRDDGHGDEKIIGAAAVWSVDSNAHQHKKVLQICKEEVLIAQGTTKAILEKIINAAK